jgi:hypothetical protein
MVNLWDRVDDSVCEHQNQRSTGAHSPVRPPTRAGQCTVSTRHRHTPHAAHPDPSTTRAERQLGRFPSPLGHVAEGSPSGRCARSREAGRPHRAHQLARGHASRCRPRATSLQACGRFPRWHYQDCTRVRHNAKPHNELLWYAHEAGRFHRGALDDRTRSSRLTCVWRACCHRRLHPRRHPRWRQQPAVFPPRTSSRSWTR